MIDPSSIKDKKNKNRKPRARAMRRLKTHIKIGAAIKRHTIMNIHKTIPKSSKSQNLSVHFGDEN